MFSNSEKVDILIIYGQCGKNAAEAERVYRQEYPDRISYPTRQYISYLLKTMRQEQNGENIPAFIVKEEMEINVIALIMQNASASIREIALTLDISKESACSQVSGTLIEKEGDFSYAPFQSFMDGNFRKIPLLHGFTSEEWLAVASLADVDTLIAVDDDPAKLVQEFINMSPKKRTIAGKLLKEIYTETSFEEDLGGYVRWSSDSVITVAVCKQAELTASVMPVYLYQFSYHGEVGGGSSVIIPGAESVAHSEDYPYMWDVGTNSDLSKFPEEDRLTVHRYVKMWTNFVKYQNPTPEKDILLENVTWTTTNSENLRYLNFNTTLEMREYPRQYAEVKTILDEYMEPPFNYY